MDANALLWNGKRKIITLSVGLIALLYVAAAVNYRMRIAGDLEIAAREIPQYCQGAVECERAVADHFDRCSDGYERTREMLVARMPIGNRVIEAAGFGPSPEEVADALELSGLLSGNQEASADPWKSITSCINNLEEARAAVGRTPGWVPERPTDI